MAVLITDEKELVLLELNIYLHRNKASSTSWEVDVAQ